MITLAVRRSVGRKRHAMAGLTAEILLTAPWPASLHADGGGAVLLLCQIAGRPFRTRCFAGPIYLGPGAESCRMRMRTVCR